jgi:predicted small lipoprotein YifL
MRRALSVALAAVAITLSLAACGSNDNGGVIQGPGTTVAPGATTTAGNSSGY